jgi:hypothetical protein
VYVPAFNGTIWSYYRIAGQFTVLAIADAARSELSACQRLPTVLTTDPGGHCTDEPTTPIAQFKSVYVPSAAIVIKVRANDIFGVPIQRAGENITLVVSIRSDPMASVSRDVNVMTVFNSTSMQYEAPIPAEVTVEGNYTVTLQTELANAPPQSLNFAVECATGYIANNVTHACESSNRCDRDDQYKAAQTLE